MENNAQTVLSLLLEQREDKKGKNRIKTEDDKGRERIERRGVTRAETFRDFSGGQAGGPLKTRARKTTLRYKPREIRLIFSFLPHLSSFLSFFLVCYSFSFVSHLSAIIINGNGIINGRSGFYDATNNFLLIIVRNRVKVFKISKRSV